MSSQWLRFGAVLLVVIAMAVVAVTFFRRSSSVESLTWDEVVGAGRSGSLQSIEISGVKLKVQLRGDANEYRSSVPEGTDFEQVLLDSGVRLGDVDDGSVEIKYKSASTSDDE